MGSVVGMPARPDWTQSFTEAMIQGAELMAEGSMSQKQIAAKVGVEEQTISRRWKHNQLWLQYVNYLATMHTLDTAIRVKGLTSKAVDALATLLQDPDPSIKLRAVKEVLDRAGVKDLEFDLLPKETKKVDVRVIKERFSAIMEADEAENNVIDITPNLSRDTAQTILTPDELLGDDEPREDGETCFTVIEGGFSTETLNGYEEDEPEE